MSSLTVSSPERLPSIGEEQKQYESNRVEHEEMPDSVVDPLMAEVSNMSMATATIESTHSESYHSDFNPTLLSHTPSEGNTEQSAH